jgi:alpha/beta superfamily hydrolase
MTMGANLASDKQIPPVQVNDVSAFGEAIARLKCLAESRPNHDDPIAMARQMASAAVRAMAALDWPMDHIIAVDIIQASCDPVVDLHHVLEWLTKAPQLVGLAMGDYYARCQLRVCQLAIQQGLRLLEQIEVEEVQQ